MFKNLSKDHLIIKIKEGCHSQIHATKKKKFPLTNGFYYH